MGAGATTLLESMKNDPNLEGYRSEFTELITKQYINYKNNDLTSQQTKELIYNALKKEDLRILMKENDLNNSNNSNNEKNSNNRYHNKNSRKFVCCVDGTDNGDITLHTMIHLIRKRDYIAFLHSPDDENGNNTKKTGYDDPTGAKEHYESILLNRGLPSNNIIFQVEPKGNYNTLTVLKRYMSLFNLHTKQKPNDATTTLDSSYVYDIPPDFILLGYDGWKGQNNTSTIPSSNDLAMRALHIPCIICKKKFPDLTKALTVNNTNNNNTNNNNNNNNNNQRKSKGNVNDSNVIQPLTYIMAIDDSERSLTGLEILLQLLKSTDRLILLHVHYPISSLPENYLSILNSTIPTNHHESTSSSISTNNIIKNERNTVRQGGITQLLNNTTEEKSNSNNNGNNNNNSAPNPPIAHSTSPHTSNPPTRRPSNANTNTNLDYQGINNQTKFYPFSNYTREKYYEILRDYGPRIDGSRDSLRVDGKEYEQILIEISSETNDIQGMRDRLVEYVNRISPDFFVIAPKSQRKLTSFTEYIINEINTSIILCKN